MSLFKYIQIALFYTTISISFCYGMEQTAKSPEEWYQEAVGDLKEVLTISEGFNTTLRELNANNILKQLVEQVDHPRAKTLYTLLHDKYLGTDVTLKERLQARIKMCFIVGLPGQASTRIFDEIEKCDDDIHSFLHDVLSSKEEITIFFNEMADQKHHGLLSGEKSILVQLTVLDNYFMIDFYKNWSSQLDAKTLATIANFYINPLNRGWMEINQPISVTYGPQSGIVPNRTSSYLDTGLRHCILAAKQDNDDAYKLLLQTLKIHSAYEVYHKQILSLYQSDDEKVQKLFDRIALEDRQAFSLFPVSVGKMLDRDPNSSIKGIANRIMNSHDRYFQKKFDPDKQSVLFSHPEDIDYFASATPFTNSVIEDQQTPKEKYDEAMRCWVNDPQKTIELFLELSNSEKAPNKTKNQARKKLAEIRNKNGYRYPEEVKESEKKSNIGYLLRQKESEKPVPTSSPTTSKRKKEHSTKTSSSTSKENASSKPASPQVLEITTTATSTVNPKKRREKKQDAEVSQPTLQQDTVKPQDNTLPAEPVLVSTTKKPEMEKVKDDSLPDQSQAEATPLSEITSPDQKRKISKTLKPSIDVNQERKPLRRTHSVDLGIRDSEQKKTKERRALKRSNTHMNMVVHTNDQDEPSNKKEKEKKKNKFQMPDLKQYIRSEEKDKRHKAEKKLASQSHENETIKSKSTQVGSEAESKSESLSCKKLVRKLSNRDLKSISDVSLSESDIDDTLSSLEALGKIDYTNRNGKIKANLKKNEMNEKGKVKANHNKSEPLVLTHTTHDKNGRSYSERPEFVRDILELSSVCDPQVKELVESIGKK
jgi:hypothetical protein